MRNSFRKILFESSQRSTSSILITIGIPISVCCLLGFTMFSIRSAYYLHANDIYYLNQNCKKCLRENSEIILVDSYLTILDIILQEFPKDFIEN